MVEESKGAFGQTPCPSCAHPVTNIRITNKIRRLRRCIKCEHSFTTYEVSDTHYRFLQASLALVGEETKNWFPGQKHRRN